MTLEDLVDVWVQALSSAGVLLPASQSALTAQVWSTMRECFLGNLRTIYGIAYQRGVEQEREACAKLADGLAFFEEGGGGEIESTWAYRNLAAKIRARGMP